MEEKRNYYTYIYWRLDINEPFYVGKGSGRRWKRLKRGKHFNNIVNKYPIAVEIIKDNLSENEAFYWEEEIIRRLVFDYGYSIDMPNNRSKEKGMHLVNKSWGGEGVSRCLSEEEKKRMGERRKGEKNPFYGRNFKESMSKGTYENWLRKNIENNTGKNNPMFGKHGKDNPNSKLIICLTTKEIFWSTVEAGKYYNCDPSGIAKCCKKKKSKQGYTIKSVGKSKDGKPLIWRYLIWKHNKRYRIKT